MPDRSGRRLLEILERLPAEQVRTLLDYAEFLYARHGETPPSHPLDIPRPAEESVVLAIRRLRATYPMLEPKNLLGETSELMTQHLLQGRDRVEVIDALEVLFRSHFERQSGDASD